MDFEPVFPLLGLGLPSVFLEGIIFPFPSGGGLAPAGFDPTFAFHAMENGVEHAIGPLELLSGAGFDLLNDGVAVTFAAGEEGEDERFSGSGDQFLLHMGHYA